MTNDGRVVYTGQAIADIAMAIPALPLPGGDVFASETVITAGGGFNVMAAARRDGVAVIYLGAIGTGPFAQIVSDALAREGIAVPNLPLSEVDTGFSVAMIDVTAERTFVSSRGAESNLGLDHLTSADVTAADVICVSGYSLLHDANRDALCTWLPTVPEQSTIIFDPSPIVDKIPDNAWNLLARQASVWTLNQREARLALRRFGGGVPDEPVSLASALSSFVTGEVVLRDGQRGAIVGRQDWSVVPTPHANAVDTNGAGDAHTGVLAASLARGESLVHSTLRANVAASIAVTRFGPATSPTSTEIDAALSDFIAM